MSHMKANFLMLIASLIWGTAFVSQTTGMGFIGPFTFSFARFFLAALTVLPLALYFEKQNFEIFFKNKNFSIIVRTDANLVEGLEKTIERIKAYEGAGADIIFPEAMKNEKEFEGVRKNSKVYLLANMTEFGKSKLLSVKKLKNLGYNIVIYPVTTQRLAMKSVEDGLKSIFKDGHQNNIIDKMQTRKRLYELVEYEKYNTPDKKITDFKTDGHE